MNGTDQTHKDRSVDALLVAERFADSLARRRELKSVRTHLLAINGPLDMATRPAEPLPRTGAARARLLGR